MGRRDTGYIWLIKCVCAFRQGGKKSRGLMNSWQWDSHSPLAPTCWVSCHELAETWHYCRPVKEQLTISVSLSSPAAFFFLYCVRTFSFAPLRVFMIYLFSSLILPFNNNQKKKKSWMVHCSCIKLPPPRLHPPSLLDPTSRVFSRLNLPTLIPPVKMDARAARLLRHGHLAM